jgi:hypothetical protein
VRTFEFQPYTHLALKAPNAARFSAMNQAASGWLSTDGLKKVIGNVEVYQCVAATGGGVVAPTISLEAADSLDSDYWTEVWSSADPTTGAGTLGIFTVILLKSVERGQPYRLGNFLRWRVDFPNGATGSVAAISFRIMMSAG